MNMTEEKAGAGMKIQAVLIDGYKNLSNVKISFDNITVLVALNNFGKSNVLSGIDFGLTFIKATIKRKKEMMANSNLIPINCSIIPETTPIVNNIPAILIFSFIPLFILNKTANPTPAPTSKPEIIVATGITF